MNTRATVLTEEAGRLPAEDRIRLVEHLLATLDAPDPAIDRAWAEEAERRLDLYIDGKASALDASDVLAKHLLP